VIADVLSCLISWRNIYLLKILPDHPSDHPRPLFHFLFIFFFLFIITHLPYHTCIYLISYIFHSIDPIPPFSSLPSSSPHPLLPYTPPTHPPTISLPLTHSSTNQGTGKERRRFAIHSQSNEKRARSGVIRRRLTVSGTRSFVFLYIYFYYLMECHYVMLASKQASMCDVCVLCMFR